MNIDEQYTASYLHGLRKASRLRIPSQTRQPEQLKSAIFNDAKPVSFSGDF